MKLETPILELSTVCGEKVYCLDGWCEFVCAKFVKLNFEKLPEKIILVGSSRASRDAVEVEIRKSAIGDFLLDWRLAGRRWDDGKGDYHNLYDNLETVALEFFDAGITRIWVSLYEVEE